MYAVAQDHLYETVLTAFNQAAASIYYEGCTFKNAHLADAIVGRMTAVATMTVTLLLEGEPVGGIETTEFAANQRTVSENTGGVSGTVTWAYQSETGKTQVTFEAEYIVHISLLRKLAESFLVALNEQEVEALLAHVKAKVEA